METQLDNVGTIPGTKLLLSKCYPFPTLQVKNRRIKCFQYKNIKSLQQIISKFLIIQSTYQCFFFCDINHRLMDSCPIISSHSLHTWFPIHHSLLFGGRMGIRREMLSQEMEKLTVKGCTSSSSSSLKKAYKRQELWITYFLIWIGNDSMQFCNIRDQRKSHGGWPLNMDFFCIILCLLLWSCCSGC